MKVEDRLNFLNSLNNRNNTEIQRNETENIDDRFATELPDWSLEPPCVIVERKKSNDTK